MFNKKDWNLIYAIPLIVFILGVIVGLSAAFILLKVFN